MKFVLFILVTGVAMTFVSDWVAGPAEHHPWRVMLFLAPFALIAGAVWFLFDGLAAAPLLAVLGAAGFGLVQGWDARDNYLTPYCSYGARTQAELDACLREVGSEEIDELETDAARFARGEITTCGRGSGPFCDEAAVAVE